MILIVGESIACGPLDDLKELAPASLNGEANTDGLEVIVEFIFLVCVISIRS